MDRENDKRRDADFAAEENAVTSYEEPIDDMSYYTTLLKAIRRAILEGRGTSRWKLVDAKKCLDILDDLENNLPDAIQYGLQMYSERERILGNSENEALDRITTAEQRATAMVNSAKKEADHIIADAEEERDAILADARERADQLVSDSEVLIRAREEAHALKNDAKIETSEMRLKANHDTRELLIGVEDVLSEAFNQISRRRKELETEPK